VCPCSLARRAADKFSSALLELGAIVWMFVAMVAASSCLRNAGSEMAALYLDSFERVWANSDALG
jgi:hypothetical protein